MIPKGDGWLIMPNDHGLPPAGAEDPVEVRAAELAAMSEADGAWDGATMADYQTCLGWSDWYSHRAPMSRSARAGWLAAQIVNGHL